MSLDNLVKIGKLHLHKARRDEIQRLLRGLECSLADARVDALSNEGRLAAAYEGDDSVSDSDLAELFVDRR